MKVTANNITEWTLPYSLALATEGKEPKRYPTKEWVSAILKAEHSPIRAKWYRLDFYDVPTWVFGHLTRHKIGVEWYIRSQRDDRNENATPRAEMPQGTLNNGSCLINAQALINISRKRLCRKASAETRDVWAAAKKAIAVIDLEMAQAMVPECAYRGICPEMRPCGSK